MIVTLTCSECDHVDRVFADSLSAKSCPNCKKERTQPAPLLTPAEIAESIVSQIRWALTHEQLEFLCSLWRKETVNVRALTEDECRAAYEAVRGQCPSIHNMNGTGTYIASLAWEWQQGLEWWLASRRAMGAVR